MISTIVSVCVIHFFIVGQLHCFEHVSTPVELGLNTTSSELVGSSTMGMSMGFQFLSAILIETSKGDPVYSCLFMLVGLFLWFIGVLCSSFTQSYDDFFGVYITFVGIGSSMVFWQSLHLVMLLEHSDIHSLPMYTVFAVGTLGDLFYSLVLPSYFVNNWRYTLMALSICGLVFGLVALGVLFFVGSKHTRTVTKPDAWSARSNAFILMSHSAKMFSFNIALIYWLVVASVFFSSFSLMAPQEAIPQILRQQGNAADVHSFSAFHAIGTFLGKLAPLLFLLTSRLALLPYVLFVAAGFPLLCVWFAVTGSASAALFSCLSGFAYGSITASLLGFIHKIGNYTSNSHSSFHLLLIPVTLAMVPGYVSSGVVFDSVLQSGGLNAAIGVVLAFHAIAVAFSAAALYKSRRTN